MGYPSAPFDLAFLQFSAPHWRRARDFPLEVLNAKQPKPWLFSHCLLE